MKEFIEKAQKTKASQKIAFTVRLKKEQKLRVEKKLVELSKAHKGNFSMQWFVECAIEAFLKEEL